MIKKLFEEYSFNLYSFILNEYKQLSLKYIDSIVLVSIIDLFYKKKVLSITKLSKKLEMDFNIVSNICSSLIDMGFISISIENQKDGKQREVLSFDILFEKIENIFSNKIEEKEIIKDDNYHYSKTLNMLENIFKRDLTNYEINILKNIYQSKIYSYEEIQNALDKIKNNRNISISMLERQLSLNKNNEFKLSDEDNRKLDEIFRKT